jgi:hypothetical protein
MAQDKTVPDLVKVCESLIKSKKNRFSEQFAKLGLRPSTTNEIRRCNEAHKDEIVDFLQDRGAENKKTTYYFTGELAGKRLFVTKLCHQDYGSDGYYLDQEEGECEIEWVGYFDDHRKHDFALTLLAFLKIMSHIIENLQADRIVIDEWKFEHVLEMLELLGFKKKWKNEKSDQMIMYYELMTLSDSKLRQFNGGEGPSIKHRSISNS